jgi:hypothetical protein
MVQRKKWKGFRLGQKVKLKHGIPHTRSHGWQSPDTAKKLFGQTITVIDFHSSVPEAIRVEGKVRGAPYARYFHYKDLIKACAVKRNLDPVTFNPEELEL